MNIPWKMTFMANQMRWSTYAKVSAILDSPVEYYRSLLVLAFAPSFNDPWYYALKNGFRVRIPHFMSGYIFREIFIDQCYDEALGLITVDTPRILEIGGNTGLFALRAKELFPQSYIKSYEPEGKNFLAFINLVMENNLQNVDVKRAAIGKSEGLATLFINRKNIGGHSTVFKTRGAEVQTVPVMTMKMALEDQDRFDLVKMDCEGAEIEILLSLREEMVNKIPLIVFETTESEQRTRFVFKHLESLGYRIQKSNNLFIADARETEML